MEFHDDHIIGQREEFWMVLAQRLDGAHYLHLRNHFDEHLANPESGVEGAYLCLCSHMLRVMDALNVASKGLVQIICGESFEPSQPPPPKEE